MLTAEINFKIKKNKQQVDQKLIINKFISSLVWNDQIANIDTPWAKARVK